MVDEGDLAQWLTLGGTKIAFGVAQGNTASGVHAGGDAKQAMYIHFVNTADRGNGAANAQGARGKHQVLAGAAEIGARILCNHEYQDGRLRVVARVRAEMQG